MGTNIIWSTDFESGNLSAWSSPPDNGGYFPVDSGDAGPNDPSVQITEEQHHSGRYSVKLTTVADLPDLVPYPGGGGGLYRQAQYPEEAYYSVWYYLPQAHQTTTAWFILRFKGFTPGSEAGIDPPYSELLDLSLQSLPGGNMTLVLSDARHQYGTSPLPDVVPIVPIGQWFQIECFYRNTMDANGELAIWLNGTKIYDVVRPMAPNPWVYFSPCSMAYTLDPPNAELYIDDVAISWTRVTPAGILKVGN